MRNKNIVEKCKKEHDPLPRLLHSHQAYDNFRREELQQDNYFYYINLIIDTISNIKYHKKFKGMKYKRINYIFSPNLKIKYPNNFIDICFNTRSNQ